MSDNQTSIQRIILSTHLWLGLCAVVCTWATFVLLHQPVPLKYLAFVLTGTISIYTFHGLVTRKEKAIDAPSESALHTGSAKFVVIGGSAASLTLYFFLDHTVQQLMLLPAALAILYVIPTYKGRRLKDFPFIKIIAIVLAWTIITYGIPVHKISHWWTNWGYNFLMLDRLFFFLALAIPFDIRDIKYDQNHSLKTIPNTIGLENSQNLALFSLFLSAGFMAMGFDRLEFQDPVRIGLLAVYLLIGIVIIQLKRQPGKLYYGWVFDGFLLLYGLSILLLSR